MVIKMNRNVMLTISGLHSDAEAESGSVETVVEAEYFERNGTHYLLYEEKEEGFQQVSKNRMKFRENLLEITRQGLLETHMIFEQGKKHKTMYRMPYGQMLLGVNTKKVYLQEQGTEIRMEVEYTLEADEEYLSDSKIVICIKEL